MAGAPASECLIPSWVPGKGTGEFHTGLTSAELIILETPHIVRAAEALEILEVLVRSVDASIESVTPNTRESIYEYCEHYPEGSQLLRKLLGSLIDQLLGQERTASLEEVTKRFRIAGGQVHLILETLASALRLSLRNGSPLVYVDFYYIAATNEEARDSVLELLTA